jgi:hypothetical protein
MMFQIRDAEGKFVASARTREAAHRALRRGKHAGSRMNRAGSVYAVRSEDEPREAQTTIAEFTAANEEPVFDTIALKRDLNTRGRWRLNKALRRVSLGLPVEAGVAASNAEVMQSLKPGQIALGGGGAAPMFYVRRVR